MSISDTFTAPPTALPRVPPRHSRRDILRAAAELFAERGYHGASMRELARRLGLIGSSLYSHVEGKQELLAEVSRHGAARLRLAAEDALEQPGRASARLWQLILGHVDALLACPAEVCTYLELADALEDPVREEVLLERGRYEETFRSVFADGVREGTFRRDLDPELSALFVLSMLNAVEKTHLRDGTLEREALAERIFGFVTSGATV